jgi:hypothetical protein
MFEGTIYPSDNRMDHGPGKVHMLFCTTVTKSHLAGARVLANSLKRHNPQARLVALLADRVDGYFRLEDEPFECVTLEQLGHGPLIEHMLFYYRADELCSALRPFLHDYLWRTTNEPMWVFLDSDIYVVGDLTDVLNKLAGGSVLVNPHNNMPAPDELVGTVELRQLGFGVFNGGFVGLRRCAAAAEFIRWFGQRLSKYCFYGVPGLFVDQVWLGHVPQYFRDVVVYTHAGANIGHWNLHERQLAFDGEGRVTSNGLPAIFFHFSGWSPDNPETVSKYQPLYERVRMPQVDVWRHLARAYRAELLQAGHDQCRKWPYAFSQFDDGTPITMEQRRRHYEAYWSGQASPGSPFARRGATKG